MKSFFQFLLLTVVLVFASCEDLVDGINDNPNDITVEDVDAELFLTGAQLANSVAQAGHLNRIAEMWSGQLIGYQSLYSNIYGYSISTAESVGTWTHIYIGVIPNLRHIRETAPNDALLVGISKVIEAHAIGTAASLFGDVPYSEINDPEIPDPKFDSQTSVFQASIALLDSAIGDLSNATSRPMSVDIYFDGNASKWKEAAYTLKARYLLQMKDYVEAYDAAKNGISSADGNMQHIPRGDAANAEGDKNLFWMILEGSRAGDIGNAGSFMMDLIDPANSASRNNAKTDETGRHAYYAIDESSGAPNKGVVEQFEPQNLVSYQENQLILAECAARGGSFDTALGHLNDLRAWLNTGAFLNANFAGQPVKYEAYDAADFNSGGIENSDGIDATRALLREIIEERYVSGFGTFMPFNDARRLRKSDGDIAVPIPLNTNTVSQHPERMPYSDDELNANSNGPGDDPGIYEVTEVNR